MMLRGSVWKDDKTPYWVIEVPCLDVSTQGETREDAFEMLKDMLKELTGYPSLVVSIQPETEDKFWVSASDPDALVELMFRRK